LKICYIVGAYPLMKCGVGDYTKKLVDEIKNRNIEVHIITSTSATNENNVYNCIEKWNINSINKILKILKGIKPDIVHIQYPSNEYKKNVMINFLPLIIRKICKCKVISTVHEYSVASKLGKIRNFISMKLSNQTVVVEKRYIDDVNKDFKKIAKKVKMNYIPIFSNIPKYDMSETELEELRKKIGLDNCKVISYFGFLNKNKGFENIIEVLKKFKEDNENVKLLFIGGINSENLYHKEILDKLKINGIENQVVITDFVEAPQMVANYLKISDVCMLPFIDGVSERNGSFLAAYIQNIPIVTTSKEGSKEDDEIYYGKPDDINKQYEDIKSIFNNSVKSINREETNSVINIANRHIEIYNMK